MCFVFTDFNVHHKDWEKSEFPFLGNFWKLNPPPFYNNYYTCVNFTFRLRRSILLVQTSKVISMSEVSSSKTVQISMRIVVSSAIKRVCGGRLLALVLIIFLNFWKFQYRGIFKNSYFNDLFLIFKELYLYHP